MGWTLADQLVASSTNVGLTVLVARSVDKYAFGSFSLAFVVFAFAVGLSRAVLTDPLIIRYSHAGADELRRASGEAAGASAVMGVLCGVFLVIGALVVQGSTATTFFALAVVLPGLLVQDAWRRAFFAAGRPASAFVNDVVWSVLQIGGALLLIAVGQATVGPLVLVWGFGAAAAAGVGAWQNGVWPRPRAGVRWALTHRGLGSRLGLDFVISQGAFTFAMMAVAAIAGLGAAGALRASRVLLGPVQVLMLAITSFALPLLSAAAGDRRGLRRTAVLISAGSTAATLMWVVPLLLLPDRVGRGLLGDSWSGAQEVLPLLGVQTLLIAVVMGAILAIKALGEASLLVRLTVIQAPLLLGGAVVGAYYAGAVGAALGFVIAHVVGTVLGWVFAWSATARGVRPDPATTTGQVVGAPSI